MLLRSRAVKRASNGTDSARCGDEQTGDGGFGGVDFASARGVEGVAWRALGPPRVAHGLAVRRELLYNVDPIDDSGAPRVKGAHGRLWQQLRERAGEALKHDKAQLKKAQASIEAASAPRVSQCHHLSDLERNVDGISCLDSME
mgnify:CR=1 FL=1